jgi:hypothetical protein
VGSELRAVGQKKESEMLEMLSIDTEAKLDKILRILKTQFTVAKID